MTANPSSPRRRIGRPPAGARAGEKVKDYPQLSLRIPADVKSKLHALSVLSGRPQWRVITDAIEAYLRSRSDAEQKIVNELAGPRRSRGRAPRRDGRARG